jgi:nitrogen regulatory protein PII 1
MRCNGRYNITGEKKADVKTMLLIRSIVRPEKKDEVLAELSAAGFNAATMVDVVGRGKQKGLKIGGMVYDEIPKILILMVVPDEEKDCVVRTILSTAKTGTEGTFGDGKIFVSPVDEVYTISKGTRGL